MIRRPAGALILVQEGDPGPRVLMIQRPHSMHHFPGLWSFPGGQEEPEDQGGREWVDLSHPVCLSTAGYLHRWNLPAPPVESWLPADNPRAVQAAARTAWREALEELGAGLSLAVPEHRGMRYLGRLSPPPQVAFGFDTRFFALAAAPFKTAPRSGEVAQVRWVTLVEALHREMPMAQPTQYVLERLGTCLQSGKQP